MVRGRAGLLGGRRPVLGVRTGRPAGSASRLAAAPRGPADRDVKTIRGPADLGKPNLFEAIGALLSGQPAVKLLRPSGIAVGADRFLYITDQERQAVMILDLTSEHHTLINRAGDTFFVSPVGVAVCGDALAVSDSALNVIFILSLDGKLKKTLDKPGGFKRVSGLAYNSQSRRLYAVDTLANEVCVFSMPEGKLIQQFGSGGTDVGLFNFPTHVFLNASGRIFISDSLNFRVQVFDPAGKYLFHVGRLGDASGHMAVPKGVGVDSFGHIYVVDSYFSTVADFRPAGQVPAGHRRRAGRRRGGLPDARRADRRFQEPNLRVRQL